MKIFTIGFTKTSAESFFSRLTDAGVRAVIDVRLNNVSQLSGFAKRDDLRYFLQTLSGIDYSHQPELAPTKELLARYRDDGDWDTYEREFQDLMSQRQIQTLPRADFESACLLCSESTPERCHRRLVAEHLEFAWGNVEISHL